ncbi:MAG: Gfo/Idh/MocA family oxidoreductase [Gemmatales bacterium]|nr:Gfo/Idh/MocA family oxidoreductase [Gemmatales bacterium]
MPRLQLGIIGLGYWAKNYIRVLGQREDTVISAICDCDPAKLQFWQEHLTQAKAYVELDRFPWQTLDGVIITTPASTHYVIARQALNHRIPVLVEKPLTLNSQEAEILCDLADKYEIPLLVGHTYLFAQPIQRLRQLVEDGELGELKYIHSLRVNLGIVRHDCDVIWDLAPHDVAILLYVLQKEPCVATAITAGRQSGSNADFAVLNLEFPGGTSACIAVSWFWPEKIRKLTIIGTRGAVCYHDKGFDSPLELYSWPEALQNSAAICNPALDKIRPAVLSSTNQEPLSMLVDHFLACIRRQSQPISNGYFGARVVRILEKVSRFSDQRCSHHGKTWRHYDGQEKECNEAATVSA